MPILETLNEDIKSAMKSKDMNTLAVLRMVKSEIKNKSINEKKENLADEDILQVIKKEIKKRQESSIIYENNNRRDLSSKDNAEISLLRKYLPAQLPREAVMSKAREILAKDKSIADFGSAMRAVMKELKGQSDGKIIKEVVEEIMKQ